MNVDLRRNMGFGECNGLRLVEMFVRGVRSTVRGHSASRPMSQRRGYRGYTKIRVRCASKALFRGV